jgi:hypothetical protein
MASSSRTPSTSGAPSPRSPLISELAPADRYDYILVVVRRNQVSALLPTLAANCSPNVVFMYNNLLGPAGGRCVIVTHSLEKAVDSKAGLPAAEVLLCMLCL